MEEDAVKKVYGEPDAVARIITGPRLIEQQWIYRGLDQQTFVNFRRDGQDRWRVSEVHRIEH